MQQWRGGRGGRSRGGFKPRMPDRGRMIASIQGWQKITVSSVIMDYVPLPYVNLIAEELS